MPDGSCLSCRIGVFRDKLPGKSFWIRPASKKVYLRVGMSTEKEREISFDFDAGQAIVSFFLLFVYIFIYN